jgi:hypothetical protein
MKNVKKSFYQLEEKIKERGLEKSDEKNNNGYENLQGDELSDIFE